jgi:hypothetical protein
MKRIRLTHRETAKNWLNALHELKYLIDNTEVSEINSYLRGKSISRSWNTFLQINKIIYRENGVYKWNDKIPVSHKLINKFREYVNDKNIKYNNQQQNLFNMPSSAIPPRPKVTKTRTPKIEFQVNNEPKNELGVIRRFLKWLWLGVIRKFLKWLW